jgi:periplasmic protein TonB
MERQQEQRTRRTACIALFTGLAQTSFGQSSGAESDEKVYDLGPGVSPPRVTKQVNPNYKTARGVKLEGAVIVVLVVSSQGVPRDVRVAKGLDKDIDQSAIDAVREWRFSPARKDDKPIAVRISLEINFHTM